MKKISLFLMLFLTIGCCFLLKDSYAAGTNTAITSGGGSGGDMQLVLCNVLKFVTGGVGKTIASFIIIGVGLGFFTGKASWAVLIGVTLGISAMFGAPAIIKAVTGGNTTMCDGITA